MIRQISNKPVTVDNYGNEVYICQYTGKYATISEHLIIGPCIPQATKSYVCTKDAMPAFKTCKQAFNETEANCNTCSDFKRVPHDKQAGGFLRGFCLDTRTKHPQQCGREYNIHPDDWMGMPCYKPRIKS